MERIYGINAVTVRLAGGKTGVHRLRLREGAASGRLEVLVARAKELGLPVTRMPSAELDAMTDIAHQGVALDVDPPGVHGEGLLDDLLAAPAGDLLFLILDGVTDPRNLGACLRSAASMGVHAVIVPKDNSAGLTPAAIKTASGGASIVPLVEVTNLARCLEKLQKANVWVVGTLLEAATTLAEVPLTGHIALVMGAEEKGLRRNTARHCDFLARIPMANAMLGFNVSVAAGICLYEARRQRDAKGPD